MLTPILPQVLGSTGHNEAMRPMGRPVQVAPVNPLQPIGPATTQMRFDRRRPELAERESETGAEFESTANGTTFAAAVLSAALPATARPLAPPYDHHGASAISEIVQIHIRDIEA